MCARCCARASTQAPGKSFAPLSEKIPPPPRIFCRVSPCRRCNSQVRTCNTDHPAFAKFSAQTPLERVTNPKAAGAGTGGGRESPAPSQYRESASTLARREQEAKQGDRKNFMIVRKRATAQNLQVYCDYGVDSYVTAIGAAVAAARGKATNPRPGTSGSLPGGSLNPSAAAEAAAGNKGAAAAAKAVRALFLQKWKSERHALLFKPLALEVGAEVHQWDQPGGQAIAPTYRVARVNVGVGELQVGPCFCPMLGRGRGRG